MESDYIYMIPLLSKELDFLGYSQLPYRMCKKSQESVHGVVPDEGDEDFSDVDFQNTNLQVTFDSREMIGRLVSVCFNLLKNFKALNMDDSDSDDCDRLKFENGRLQVHITSLKKEIEDKIRIITEKNEKCRQLQRELSESERKVNNLVREKVKIINQYQSNENTMKHNKRILENDLAKMQSVLWKQCNIVNSKYLPQNFEILNLKQPDFKNVWSEIKYSSCTNRERALKKAVCMFQENNEILLEDNSLLKTLLFIVMEELSSLVELFSNKMNLSCRKLNADDLKIIFIEEKRLVIQRFKNYFRQQLSLFNHFLETIHELSFSVGDNLFVSLTDVIKKIISLSQF